LALLVHAFAAIALAVTTKALAEPRLSLPVVLLGGFAIADVVTPNRLASVRVPRTFTKRDCPELGDRGDSGSLRVLRKSLEGRDGSDGTRRGQGRAEGE
ncbi:hypothetical protein PFISCL1PPCAC_25661, partial [Pristionchus fissidentatus]